MRLLFPTLLIAVAAAAIPVYRTAPGSKTPDPSPDQGPATLSQNVGGPLGDLMTIRPGRSGRISSGCAKTVEQSGQPADPPRKNASPR